MSAMIDSLDARVERVVVDRLENNTYYAKIVMRKRTAKKDIIIDARPSDSIALALRSNAPIFVENAVLDAAGMSASGGVSP